MIGNAILAGRGYLWFSGLVVSMANFDQQDLLWFVVQVVVGNAILAGRGELWLAGLLVGLILTSRANCGV